MIQNKMIQNENIYLDTNNLYSYAMSQFLPRNGFQWINPKEFELNKYTSHSLKESVLEVDIEYPKKLHELHNNYPLAPDKIEILSEYQLKIYTILILLTNFCLTFLVKKILWFIMRTYKFTWDLD